jgi:hypothetical protein
MKEIASGIWRDVNGWEGEQHVMQSRSIRRSGQPTRASALSNAWYCRFFSSITSLLIGYQLI